MVRTAKSIFFLGYWRCLWELVNKSENLAKESVSSHNNENYLNSKHNFRRSKNMAFTNVSHSYLGIGN